MFGAPVTNDRCTDDEDDQDYTLLQELQGKVIGLNESSSPKTLDWQEICKDYKDDNESWQLSFNDDNDYNFWDENDNSWPEDNDNAPLWSPTTNEDNMKRPFPA